MNKKERFFGTVEGQAVDRTPVFPLIMSFAAERAGLTYRTFASDGHALAEAQLQFSETFPVDAITVSSDAFRLTADLGGEIVFPDQTPPFLAHPLITDAGDLARLKRPDPFKGRMGDRACSLKELSRRSDCALLGWVDMPFAEACSACGVTDFMLLILDDPSLAHRILEFLTECVIAFAGAQIESGAHMIGAGDAAASLISPKLYREFALPYEQRVCEAVHRGGGLVKLHICGNTTALLEDMVLSGADLFNVDHMVDLARAKRIYDASNKAFKGNLDPVGDLLQSTPEECFSRAQDCIRLMKGSWYMLSPGCEVPTGVPDETLMAFCRAVR